MALNPNIALGLKPVEMPDTMEMATNFSNLQRNQALVTQAQAGARAQTAQAAKTEYETQRAVAGKQALTNESAKFTAPDGTVDYQGLSQRMQALGFPEIAQEIGTAQTTRATAGRTQAESDAAVYKAQQDQAFQNWMTANGKSFFDVDPKTGKVQMSPEKLTKGAADAGFTTQVAPIAKQYLDNKNAEITNAKSAVELQEKSVGAAQASMKVFGPLLQNTPLAQRQTAVDNMAAHMEETNPGSSIILFGAPDKDGHYKVPTDKDVARLTNGSITPLEERQLALQRGSLDLARQQFDWQKQVESGTAPGVMTPERRQTLELGANLSDEKTSFYGDSAGAGESVMKQYSVGQAKVGDVINKFVGNTEVGKLRAGVNQYNADHPQNRIPDDMPVTTVIDTLKNAGKLEKAQADTFRKQMQPVGKNIGPGSAQAPVPPTPPAAAAPAQEETIRVVNPQGKIVRLPKSVANEAITQGGYKLAGKGQ